jgi:hypothetical protein
MEEGMCQSTALTTPLPLVGFQTGQALATKPKENKEKFKTDNTVKICSNYSANNQ